MKKTLIPKLIFGYVLFVALGFIILCTFTQHAITHYAENREAQQLYRESVQIASGYADNYNKYGFSKADAKSWRISFCPNLDHGQSGKYSF